MLTELTRANHDPAVIAQVRALMEQSAKAQQVLAEKDFKITALTLESAYYRRIKFGKKSEALSGEQRELFEETVNTDLAAIEAELVPPDTGDGDAGKRKRSRAGRQALPAELPRVEHRHEPESCECAAPLLADWYAWLLASHKTRPPAAEPPRPLTTRSSAGRHYCAMPTPVRCRSITTRSKTPF